MGKKKKKTRKNEAGRLRREETINGKKKDGGKEGKEGKEGTDKSKFVFNVFSLPATHSRHHCNNGEG